MGGSPVEVSRRSAAPGDPVVLRSRGRRLPLAGVRGMATPGVRFLEGSFVLLQVIFDSGEGWRSP